MAMIDDDDSNTNSVIHRMNQQSAALSTSEVLQYVKKCCRRVVIITMILACWVASASTGISDVFWARGRNMRASAGKGFTYAPLSLSCQKLSKR